MNDYPVGVERRCVDENEVRQRANLAAANGLAKCSNERDDKVARNVASEKQIYM